MNKAMLVLIVALVAAGQLSEAREVERPPLTLKEKEKIAWALKILAATKSLEMGENDEVQVNSNIIDEIERDGLLESENSRMSSVCIGPGR